MNNPLNIPVILGSSRPERQSEKAAVYIHKLLQKTLNVEAPLVDVRDFPLEYDDKVNQPKFHAIVMKADAFVLVFPEYNHGYPGKLKTLLDTGFNGYKHKPVVLTSVSSGSFGGIRAAELLTPVLTYIGLIVTGLNIQFPNIQDTFDEFGNPTDPKLEPRVQKTLEKLIYLTKVIKAGKEQVSDVIT